MLFKSDDHLAGIGFAEGASVALFELVTEFLRPVFTAHWNDVRPGISVDDAAEWILRTRDGLHSYLQGFLLPAIVRRS